MAMRRPEPRSGGRGEVGEELNGRVKQLGGGAAYIRPWEGRDKKGALGKELEN